MAESSGSLNNKISRTRVSSVLNKDVKQFGKQHLFDGDEETCWNSDQVIPKSLWELKIQKNKGALQWVMVDFNEEVQISEIHIQFQGGFVGKVCSLEKSDSGSSNLIKILNFCPSDSSQKQVFKLPEFSSLSTLKILFEQSTDLFGRITIYNLDIIGKIS